MSKSPPDPYHKKVGQHALLIDGLSTRTTTLEGKVGILESADREQNERLTRIDERLKIMGESAQQNSETQAKSMTELKGIIEGKHTSTLDFVRTMCLELQQPIDLLLNTMGVNEDAKAPGNLKENLRFLDKLRSGREETVKKVWNILIQAGVVFLLGLLATGFIAWIYSKTGMTNAR